VEGAQRDEPLKLLEDAVYHQHDVADLYVASVKLSPVFFFFLFALMVG
jgi:hypothetical protein